MVISWLAPKKQLFDRVQREFQFSLENRFRIIAELEKYKAGEDEGIWKQKIGQSTYQYEVYFDGEFVCFFGLEDSEDVVYLRVMENILRLYKDKQIFWNPILYEVNKLKPVEEKLPEATTPEEKLLKEAVKRSRKKKGKHGRTAPRHN